MCGNAEEIVKKRESMALLGNLAFYNYKGTLLKQYPIPKAEGMSREYEIKGIIYHDNKITALYVQEDDVIVCTEEIDFMVFKEAFEKYMGEE